MRPAPAENFPLVLAHIEYPHPAASYSPWRWKSCGLAINAVLRVAESRSKLY
jgi:hypothetical protein